MRVLNAGQYDIAGDGIRTKQAFARHAPDWSYNVIAERSTYLDYPPDRDWSDLEVLAAKADVLHVRNTFAVNRVLGSIQPTVIHHHGTIFRRNRDALLCETARRGAVGLAATLDLWLMAPDDLTWLPAPFDLDWLASFRRRAADGPLRIAHAPTNRERKGTPAFLLAVEKLQNDIDVELILIEGQPWQRCLELKGSCDIYFDQTTYGYGNNAVECWGMGIPVIAGGQPDTLAEMVRRFGSLPFKLADEGSLHTALLDLALDADERDAWSARGLDHVSQWHDEKRVVEQLKQVYAQAAGGDR